MSKIDCKVCGGSHDVDNYGWVHSCIGYYQLADVDNEINKYLEKGNVYGKSKNR